MELSYGAHVKLDRKDRKILAALAYNARMTPSQLARTIGLSRNAIRLRIKHLEEQDVLRGSVTILNLFSSGLEIYGLLLRYENLREKEEATLLQHFVHHPFIIWFARSSGQWDFLLYLMAQNPGHLDSLLSEIKKASSCRILAIETMYQLSLVKYFLFHGGLCQELNVQPQFPIKDSSYGKFLLKPPVSIGPSPAKIDEKDLKILSLLAENATLSLKSLGEQVKLSPDTVDYRILNLIKKEVILAFDPLINMSYLHYHTYLLLAEFRSNTQDKEKRAFFLYCKSHPDTSFVMGTGGRWHASIYFIVKNPLEFFNIVNELRNRFGEMIQSYESLLIIKDYKFTFLPQGLLRLDQNLKA